MTTNQLIEKFFSSLSICDSPELHLSIHIGTDKDPVDLICSGNDLLKDAADLNNQHSCNANWCLKPLQVPCSIKIRWAVGAFNNCNTTEFQTVLQLSLDKMFKCNLFKKHVIILVCPQCVHIDFNCQKKKNNKNNDDNDSACHAFHIKVECGMDKATKHCIHIAIKMLPCIVSHADIPFAWVPMVAKDSSSQDVNHSHHTLAHHKSLQSLSECSCITSIKDLNVTSMCLSNKTLCKLISDSCLPSDNTKKAFILAEMACNGEALLCHMKKQAEEVKLIVECLLLFLQCKHPNAGEEAGDCFWDEEKNCPSSHIMAKLKENLADAKISSADWVITGVEMLKDNENKDNNKEEACSMRKPAWENASFKS